jgi:hypothetical protein
MIKKVIKSILAAILLILVLVFFKIQFLGKKLNTETIKPFLTTSTNQHDIELTYLGCAGFIIEYQNKSILCDPFISNPSFLNFGKKHVEWSKVVPEKKLKKVEMVTVSHGHYDHCYDAAELNPYIQPDSKIIADKSVLNQLHSVYANTNFQPLPLDFQRAQNWIYSKDSLFRIFPLQSNHSPHFGHIELFKGNYQKPLAAVPSKMWQWLKGEDFSYMIDVMNQDSIVYRMTLVNGTITAAGIKALKILSQQRTSDLQLQIFWKEKLAADDMMEIYTIVHPKQIILHHWNNFFVSFDKPLQYLRDSHLPKVLKKYNEQDLKTSVMLPFTSVQL